MPPTRISTEIDYQAVYLSQRRERPGDFICYLNSDEPRKHGDLQISHAIIQMPSLNQRRFDEM